jgi:lysine 6-dehydrogenase
MRFLILGAGLQGSACAFDLLRNSDVTQVRLASLRMESLPPFLAPFSGTRLIPTPLDVKDHEAVGALMRDSDAVACALPYYFNLGMARLAAECGVHFCDLGGNTDIVLAQKKLDETAREAGISIIPDCGLAPGMVNILAQQGIDEMDSVDSVRMYVGGLPQHPEPPLGYQIVYSIEGMLDYYTTRSWLLRDSRLTQIDALTELEDVSFPAPLGTLEAFHTAGGLSTMGMRYEDRIARMEYKTLRYPGHVRIISAIRDLGLLDTTPLLVGGVLVSPRNVFIAAAEPHLRKPGGRDLVALRVEIIGTRRGQKWRVLHELTDYYDADHDISAMMRTTGYSLAVTTLMQARGLITARGVHTPDECVPPESYVLELAERGVNIVTTRGAA